MHVALALVVALAPAVRGNPAAATQPATRPAGPADAERLIEALAAAADWKARDAAERRLVEMGEPAVAPLEAALRRGVPPEVHSRIASCLKQIEATRPTTPTRVTVRMAGTPEEVLAEIGRQAGVEFGIWPPWLFKMAHNRRVTLDLTDRPFWPAMKEACNAIGGISVERAGDKEQIILTGRHGWGKRPGCNSGPVYFTVDAVDRGRRADYVTEGDLPAVRERFEVQLTAWTDPKVRVLRYRPLVHVESAADEKGNRLTPGSVYGQPEDERAREQARSRAAKMEKSDGPNNFKWKLTVPLERPDNAGHEIRELKGAATFLVQTKAAAAEVKAPLAAKAVGHELAGMKVTLHGVTRDGDHYTARLRADRGDCDRERWDLLDDVQVLRSCVVLFDEQGRRLVNTGGRHEVARNAIEFEVRFTRVTEHGPARGEPVRLLLTVPAETMTLPVPFEFTELVLP